VIEPGEIHVANFAEAGARPTEEYPMQKDLGTLGESTLTSWAVSSLA
jgi:hypothetical protein